MAPWTIPGYSTQEPIGEGSFASVFRAIRAHDHQEVAVKLPRADLADDDLARANERILREARLLATFDHPNIARLLASGTLESGRAYLVTPFYGGGSLGDTAHERRLRDDPSQLVDLARSIVSALAYTEDTVVHRDLKPANILFDFDDTPILADFGEGVESLDLATGAPGRAGSNAFMSVAQLIDNPSGVDSRADLWALGVTMYRLVSGRHPFGEEKEAVFVGQALPLDTTPLGDSHAPAEVLRLVRRCLSREAPPRSAHALFCELFIPSLDPDQIARQTATEAGNRSARVRLAVRHLRSASECGEIETLGMASLQVQDQIENARRVLHDTNLELPDTPSLADATRTLMSRDLAALETLLEAIQHESSEFLSTIENWRSQLPTSELATWWAAGAWAAAPRTLGDETPESQRLRELLQHSQATPDLDPELLLRILIREARRRDRDETDTP